MMKRISIALAIMILFVGSLVCSSKVHALYVYMQASATGGVNLGLNDFDWTDGWEGDYVAEATHNSTVAPYLDQGYAKASLTGAGVDLKSRSNAPDFYATSAASYRDYFIVQTNSGTVEAVLDAVSNFDLTGTIEVLNPTDSEGSLHADLMARQGSSTGPLLDYIVIDYDVYWDSAAGQYVGFNDTTWSHIFEVAPTVTGTTWDFNVPLSLDLDDMMADDLIYLELKLTTSARNGAIVDFSNTLKPDQDNPFVLTSCPPGSSYILETGYSEVDGVSLFGDLDGQELGAPVPVPAPFFLLGSGLIGLLGVRRKVRDRRQ